MCREVIMCVHFQQCTPNRTGPTLLRAALADTLPLSEVCAEAGSLSLSNVCAGADNGCLSDACGGGCRQDGVMGTGCPT